MSTMTMAEEMVLALKFRDSLHAIKPQNFAVELYDAIEEDLLKLLYAKNKNLAEIAYQQIKSILAQNLKEQDATFLDLDKQLSNLLRQRNSYLTSPSQGFFGFWAEENWIGANLAVLALPFIVGSAFPIAGVGLLIYSVAVSASAGIDVMRNTPNRWLEEFDPASRELTDVQRDILRKKYPNSEHFFPENYMQPKPSNTDRRSYALYWLVFAISVIGLLSFLFPPIGIPAIALLLLSVVAMGATGLQAYLLLEKRNKILGEIDAAQAEMHSVTYHQHDSTAMINQKLPRKKNVTPPRPKVAKQKKSAVSVKKSPRKILEETLPIQTQDEEGEEGEGNEGPHQHL